MMSTCNGGGASDLYIGRVRQQMLDALSITSEGGGSFNPRTDQVQRRMSGQGIVTSTSPDSARHKHTLEKAYTVYIMLSCSPVPLVCTYVFYLIFSDSQDTNGPYIAGQVPPS